MFSSGTKTTQRCNGIVYQSSLQNKVTSKDNYHHTITAPTTHKLANKLEYRNVHNNCKKVNKSSTFVSSNGKLSSGNIINNIKSEVTHSGILQDFEDKIAIHSIIGFNESSTHKPPVVVEKKVKKAVLKGLHHEALQRIECESDEFNYYQQHWFSPSLEKLKMEDRSREERIEITRHEILRRLQQMHRSHVGKPNKMPDWIEQHKHKVIARLHNPQSSRELADKSNHSLVKMCEVNECNRSAVMYTKYCVMHIMYDSKQTLFEYCTAKFADNTQCSVPVFDISHELPLCREHARKRDNYRLYQEAKPKKIRKKVKPSAMIRPQKRSKKKKKSTSSQSSQKDLAMEIGFNNNSNSQSSAIGTLEAEITDTPGCVVLEEDLQMVDHVLELNENGLEQALVNQAHLLEESDITNVLSTIQVDEFSDFFAVNRNGEYEPSREEAEELEKALAAVDNDVKSLEKLSQTHGLLDSFLDEHTLTDSLVQIPEMIFHNGYAGACGDNIVAQSGSFLLPVEPQSHS